MRQRKREWDEKDQASAPTFPEGCMENKRGVELRGRGAIGLFELAGGLTKYCPRQSVSGRKAPRKGRMPTPQICVFDEMSSSRDVDLSEA